MISIKDITGKIRFSTEIKTGSVYRKTLMKEDYILLYFSVYQPVLFEKGDYCDTEFGRFEIVDLVFPKYNTSTGGYDYELRLDAEYYKWKNKILFYDRQGGNREASWNLTRTPDAHLSIVVSNLKSLGYTYNSGVEYTFSIDSTVEKSAKLVQYDNTNIIDALTKIAETWDAEWWIVDHVIHLGRCEYNTAVDFELNGLVSEMSRSESNDNYATRVYAFGSTRNLPTNYRPDITGVVVDGVVQRRLMLPEGTPYVDAFPDMSTEEAVEEVVVFEDVYPKRIGTMSDVTTKEYTDKIENEDGTTTEVKWNAYRFRDSGITFSKEYIIPGQELRIVFQSGPLNGMDFAVTFNPGAADEKNSDGSWNSGAQLWEIVRNEDYGRELPSAPLIPENGNTYVLYGYDTKFVSVSMIPDAEKELLEKTKSYVEKSKIDPSVYTCVMDPIKVGGFDGGRVIDLEIGDRVNIINPAYAIKSRQSRIYGFEKALDKKYEVTYTVGQSTKYSRIGEIESKVEALTYKGEAFTGSGTGSVYIVGRYDKTRLTDRNALSSLRSLETFLRKDQNDTTPYKLTIRGGIETGWDQSQAEPTASLSEDGILNAAAAILKEYISSPKFIPGFTGEGAKLYKDEAGNWTLECDIVTVRKMMKVFELIIQKIRSVNGALVISQSNSKVVEVTEDGEYYVLDFGDDQPTFQAHDLVRHQVFSGNEVEYYWVEIDRAEGSKVWILKSEFNGVVPKQDDELVQMGNTQNVARQSLIYLSAEEGSPQNEGLGEYSSLPATVDDETQTIHTIYSGTVDGKYFKSDLIVAADFSTASLNFYKSASLTSPVWTKLNATPYEFTLLQDLFYWNGGYVYVADIYSTETLSAIGYSSDINNLFTGAMAVSDLDAGVNFYTYEKGNMGFDDDHFYIGWRGSKSSRDYMVKFAIDKSGTVTLYKEDMVYTKAMRTSGNYMLSSDRLSLEVRSLKNSQFSVYDIDDTMTDAICYKSACFLVFTSKSYYSIENGSITKKEYDLGGKTIGTVSNSVLVSGVVYAYTTKGYVLTFKDGAQISTPELFAGSEQNGEAGRIFNDGKNVIVDISTPNAYFAPVIQPVANGHPVIDILDGVNSKTFEGKLKTRIGYLGGITDTDFPASYQPSGYGIYSINAFLKGIFILRNGKTIEQEFESTNKEIDIAKTDAKAAQDRLNTWADDGVISPTEKTALKQEMEALKAERDSILANASRYGIDTVAYRNAFNDYYHVLETHSASEPENIPVSASFKTLQQAYYDQQRVIIDAINSASYSYVGEKVKIETDTIMEALPGQITLVVKGEVSKVKVGDVNLLYGGYREKANAAYNIGYYHYDTPVVDGKEYTLTVCYTLGSDNTYISAYSNGGTTLIASFVTKGDKVVESTKITMKRYKPGEGMYFFQFPNGTFGSKVHWAVLTDGNIGVTQWIPSASERVAGIKNLCSYSNIVKAGFTYAMEYKEDGHIGINLGALNVESSVPEKDMFGLVYDDSKRYVLFIDDVDYGYEIDPNTNTMYINVKYKDGTSEGIQLVGTKPSKDYIITSKPVKCIVGTYYVAYNPFARIGLYETYELVSWSPAPEDLNYIAKTYTDSEIKVTKGLIESKVSQTDFDALGQVVSNQGTEISQTKTDINLVSTVSGNARLIALAMSKGKMLNRDPEFRSGLNGIGIYNNSGNGMVAVERAADINLPNQSGYKIKITTSGAVEPGLGGFTFSTKTRANAVFITRFIAWVPVGYRIEWATNAGAGGKWLTNNVGTGDWEEYAFHVKCASSGTFSSTNYFYLAGGSGSLPVTWYLAFATVYDAGSIDDTPTKDELKTGITIKPGAINIFGQDISFAGKITFSSLDSGSQSTINAASSNASSAVSTANSAASTANSAKNTADSAASSAGSALATANSAKGVADSAASAAATAKNIADSAKSGLDSLKNGLGSLAYKNLVEKAELGTTIISGGYIKSELIEVDAILAGKIGAASITTGNLTVTDGSYLGGWQIQNNAIYSRNIADAKIQLEINGYRFLRINQYGGAATVGSYPLMEIRNDNQDCLSLSTYGQGGKALRIIANSEGGHAIQSHGSHLFGQRNSESWNAPGILCGVYVYAGGTGNQFWGNGCTVGTVSNISTGRYRIYHNLGHTKYSAIIQASDDNGWCFGMVKSITSTYLEVHLVDANQGDRNVNFYLYLVGRNVW